jgi:exopolyphosphatase/pppGpp-phosphohydrolase
MPQWLQWSLIIAGLIAIVLMLVFIRRQVGLLSENRKRQAKTEAFQANRRKDMIRSVHVIAMAVEEDQIEYSEACLRLKGLLDHIAPDLLERPPFRVFQEVHDRLQHMPTHRARQATETRFVEKMDKERFEVEHKHADQIRRAATALRHHSFSPDTQ